MKKKYFHVFNTLFAIVVLSFLILLPRLSKYQESAEYFIELLESERSIDHQQLMHVADFISAQNINILNGLSFSITLAIYILIMSLVPLFLGKKATKRGH